MNDKQRPMKFDCVKPVIRLTAKGFFSMTCLMRKYMHLYIKPCSWLIVHPASLMKGIRILHNTFENRCYLSTLPRSGTEYITCLLTSACDLKAGGTGEYKFVNNEWVHNIKIIWPSTLHNFVAVLKSKQAFHKNSFMMAHHPIQKTNMFSVDSMKVVFTIRNIHDQLESWLLHTFDEPSAQDRFIGGGYVERTINHFNYWGDFISRPGMTAEKDYVCIRYEDIIADPLANLRRVVKLWALDIDDSILEKAVELCSREKMKSKIPPEALSSNKRLTVRENRGQLFSKENSDYIDRAIQDKLRYDFGYNYLHAPAVGS